LRNGIFDLSLLICALVSSWGITLFTLGTMLKHMSQWLG
jgi:hypothetical protein